MRPIVGTLIAGGALNLSVPAPTQTLTQVLGHPVSAKLSTPVFVTSWPGNADILVVAERGIGKVTYWDTSTPGVPTHTILDLSAQAWVPGGFSEFVGVTAVVFHPHFLTDPAQRFIYVRFNSQGSPTTNVVRYKIPPGSLKANPASATTMYTWPTVSTGHGSGTLQFDTRPGHEHRLYVPMPDDSTPGNCCDEARVQGIGGASDLGQLMVVEVNSTPPVAWNAATGLRNPFGFSVDRGDLSTFAGRGDVWIGAVGTPITGSILRWVPAGLFRNYGWPWYEGDASQPWTTLPSVTLTNCGLQTYSPPTSCGLPPGGISVELPYSVFSDFVEYGGAHDALIGGYTYRNDAIPALQNRYVFATYSTQGPRIYSLPVTGTPGAPTNHTTALGMSSWGPSQFFIHGLGQDAKGDLYVVRVDQSSTSQLDNGAIFLVTP